MRVPGRDMSYEELLHGAFRPAAGRGDRRSDRSPTSTIPAHPLGGTPGILGADVRGCGSRGRSRNRDGRSRQAGPRQRRRQGAQPADRLKRRMKGAAVMGLGHTFMEQLLLDDHGCIRNLGALDYRIPTIQDVPEALHSILIENEDGPGPYGAKGAGEGGILVDRRRGGRGSEPGRGRQAARPAVDAGAGVAGHPRCRRSPSRQAGGGARPCAGARGRRRWCARPGRTGG